VLIRHACAGERLAHHRQGAGLTLGGADVACRFGRSTYIGD
jgi:hypothetical protein